MHIHNLIFVLFTECLLHVLALTAPSSCHFSKPPACYKVVTMDELQSRAITTKQYIFKNNYKQPYNKQTFFISDKNSP